MRIVQDQVDGETFLEILFDRKDLEHVLEYMIPNLEFEFRGLPVTLGVRLDLPEHEYECNI